MKNLYDQILRRKSFHTFHDTTSLSKDELDSLTAALRSAVPLDPSIRTAFKIVPAGETSVKNGAEYCILFYSEESPYKLANIGYIGEQIDLWCASKNIGACWFGLGKTKEKEYEGLDFIIMMAIAKVPETAFRKSPSETKRKPLEDFWTGDPLGIGETLRYSPSGCNSQPWLIESNEGSLKVFRYETPGKRLFMPLLGMRYMNRIDIGIFLAILEICLEEKGIPFTRTLSPDPADGSVKTLNAEYVIK